LATKTPQRLSPGETFDRYIDLFITHCRALNYSPRTVDDFYYYEFRTFRRYLDDLHPGLFPEHVTTDTLRAFHKR
jgi:hypothetical protein